MVKLVRHFRGADLLKEGERLAYDSVFTFKDKADLDFFQEDPALGQFFHIRIIYKVWLTLYLLRA